MELGDESQSLVLFGQEPVRRTLHEGRWFYSVVDTCAVLAKSENPRVYWGVLKKRLADQGANQVITNCKQLKLRAPDGRLRETDCADTETLLRIIQDIPSPHAEPFKQWLAQVGADIIEERTEDQKRIEARDRTKAVNKQLHDEIHGRGVRTPKAHAQFEERGHERLYGGETIRETDERRDIQPSDDRYEWMGSEELIDNLFAKSQTQAYIKRLDVQGKEPVMQAHEDVSQAVRDTIIGLGNTPPEDLPKAHKTVEQAKKDEERRRLRGIDLFPEIDGE